ncbi:hypothetical protein ACH5RR_036139 [Cinchona calisaya]|uniref:Aluminum-activated malate transporter n=1 Tax=Cinchona calisaya TaxID=153742 RepID=A0ABD2Y691_9GENT
MLFNSLGGSFASYFILYPTMAPYEYRYRVFVLTFCILMVAGNRSKENIEAILTRVVRIAFGAVICFLVNISIYPIWAGEDLLLLVVKNFTDLATSLEACVDGYLKGIDCDRIHSKTSTYQYLDDPVYQGYRSVIESTSREQTLE